MSKVSVLFSNYTYMKLDMHFHSTASDGYDTKQEIIAKAKQLNIDFMTLTDHDVVSYGFKDMCRDEGILSCDSVEISASNKTHNKSLHLTFYAAEISEEIGDILSGVVRTKVGLIEKQVLFFNSIGFQISLDNFYEYFQSLGRKKESLNKFDICYYMYLFVENRNKATEINEGQEISVEAFYQQFLKKGGDGFDKYAVRIKDYEITLEQCSQFKKQVNGILALAHPNVTFKKGGIEEFELVLPYYVDNGVNAIEINSKATKDWIEAILKAKEKFGLYLTFGSDNHKMGHSDNKHGDFGELNNCFSGNDLLKRYFNEYRERLGV